MNDLQHIRKTMVWGTPLCMAIAAGCIVLMAHALIPTLHAMVSHADAVRITPAAQVAPFVAFTCLLAIVRGTLCSVPCSEGTAAKLERAFHLSAQAGMFALALVPVNSIAQRVYMPSAGYSVCTELQGSPSAWFTDWVRDPAWCVKGNSLEWVNERARATDS
ncbi:hypothetical protein M4R22_19945 [Acidovorax sp. GBBC 3334]|uniref:hypothetical protein n=1 Tax=Acidovorax sp. GBBC 3334 TaxID=2940496 RepID=UPI0023024CAB|nr:hypothetical protein [Acidovorax sp. GBBC 3334]MDA8457037.1 hypothetical protein [Acidovorax sp. GBBC 3334]